MNWDSHVFEVWTLRKDMMHRNPDLLTCAVGLKRENGTHSVTRTKGRDCQWHGPNQYEEYNARIQFLCWHRQWTYVPPLDSSKTQLRSVNLGLVTLITKNQGFCERFFSGLICEEKKISFFIGKKKVCIIVYPSRTGSISSFKGVQFIFSLLGEEKVSTRPLGW